MCSHRNLFWPCFLILLLPTLSRAESLPDWTKQIRTDHPRLFFNADTWPEVRERASGAENDWYLRIKARVDRQLGKLENTAQPKPQELGPEAARAAFVFLMTDDDRYRQLALKCLDASLAYANSVLRRNVRSTGIQLPESMPPWLGTGSTITCPKNSAKRPCRGWFARSTTC